MDVFLHGGDDALAAQIGAGDNGQPGFDLIVHQLFVAVGGEQDIPEWDQPHAHRQHRKHEIVLDHNADHHAHRRQEQGEGAEGGKLAAPAGQDHHFLGLPHRLLDALDLSGVVELPNLLGDRRLPAGKGSRQILRKLKGRHAQQQENTGQHTGKGQQDQYNQAVSSFPSSISIRPPAICSSRRGGIPFSSSRFCRLAEIGDTF